MSRLSVFLASISLLLMLALVAQRSHADQAAPWRPDHTVIVVLENLSAYDATAEQISAGNAPVYGNGNWKYLNELATNGAKFTQSHFARTPYGSPLPTRPSQPNYLFLFSGHHQGVLPGWFADDHSPYQGTASADRFGKVLPLPASSGVGVGNRSVPNSWLPFQTPNLGAAITKNGGTFASFSESLPYPSWNCATDDNLVACDRSDAPTDLYRRKHNPAINWTDQNNPKGSRGLNGDPASHVLPVAVNLAFTPTRDPTLNRSFRGFIADENGRPLDFAQLPTVSLVIPNEQHNAHSESASLADSWLRDNIAAYAQWAKTHNSLLIVTFDEDGATDTRSGDPYQTGTHRIATIFYGAGVKAGEYAQSIDHLNVLSTVLWLHGSLTQFRDDFHRAYQIVDGSNSEAELEWKNLRPVVEAFSPVPAVRQSHH